ncbi:MAG: DUF4426 domain-containing protein [Pseudomonadaceae bacterium]|nr:DUF4426 domain-containing protein [Pseudomonadaceae bacterium]
MNTLAAQLGGALAAMALLLSSLTAAAEQAFEFDDYDIHYVVIPTVFLSREIAEQYDIVRGTQWSLVNISVLDKTGTPRRARASGGFTNLLSQNFELEFREVLEDNAVYYLAAVKHTDEDIFRFDIDIQVANGDPMNIQFTNRMYRGLE